MKKYLVVLSVSLGLFVDLISADELKNSLTNMLLNEKKTSSSMVNLSGISVDGKPQGVPELQKTRSPKAVVATVNGHKVFKKEADAHINKRTQGKITDFDRLPEEQRLRIIEELSLPILALDSAEKELSAEAKEDLYKRIWMQQKASKLIITDAQVQAVYDQLKQRSEENNNTANIPTFDSIKDKLKSQMIEKKIIDKLMKDVKIKVEDIN